MPNSIILPWKNEGTAYNSVKVIRNAALAAGHKVPENFLFYAGQVFYRDRKPEEVRLSGFLEGTALPWTTPTPPMLTQRPDGELVLDPTDEGRTYLSALTIRGEKVALLWDLGVDSLDTILLKTESPLFQTGDVAIVATPGVMLSSVQALIRKDLWKDDKEGKPFLRRGFSENRFVEHYITAFDPSSRDPEALAGKAAWQIIEQFGVSTAYLHLIFSAYAAEQDKPWMGMFHLKGTDLIKTLGMDKRTDLSKTEKLKEIAQQAHLLGSLGVWVVWSEGKKMDLNVRTSRMWDVAIDLHGQLGLFGKEREKEKTTEPTEITITIRPGLWTEKFLSREGQRAGTALRQFGYLAKETLKINPYQKELAAKLAVYLTIMGRIRETYRVKTLLEAVEPKEVLALAQQDHRRRYELKQRWDSALLDLKELGWKIEFNPEAYPQPIWPDWTLPEEEHRSSRKLPTGYLSMLLESRITIAQPEPIPQLIATGIEKPTHESHPLPKWLTGKQVKEVRKAKGWSQRDLAVMIGKSQPWIVAIEKGQRKIQPEDQEQLRKVLDITE